MNTTNFNIKEIISIVKRDGNKKREFLLLNKLQSKHYPSDPLKTDELFSSLADKVKKEYSKEQKILIIGFAETAISIGIYVAKIFKNSNYIQTTREIIENKSFLMFDETHSHAVTHRLYTDNLKESIEQSDLIIIVDDEFTTGNTAINLVTTLKSIYKIKDDCKICMASILSCMDIEHLKVLEENNINLITLVDATINIENITFSDIFFDNTLSFECYSKKNVLFKEIEGKGNLLFLDSTKNIINKTNEFVNKVIEFMKISSNNNESILVIGTEEFSFCALQLGIKLKEKTSNVSVQCTTRSPILASKNPNYAVNNRISISSIYDINRIVYIYQMKHYDTAIILTDCENPSEDAKRQLINSIDADKIFFIKWSK